MGDNGISTLKKMYEDEMEYLKIKIQNMKTVET